MGIWWFCEKVANVVVNKSAESIPKEGPWYSWPEGAKTAKEEKKPIFILVHNPECKGCIAFKEEFRASLKVQELCSRFVLVSILKSNATKEFSPDGDYVPRVFFADYKGSILKIFNELGNPRRMYKYVTMRSLLVSMEDALKMHEKTMGD